MRPSPGLRPLVGLMMAGYGALVLAGVLPHDAPWAGAASLALGLLALGVGLPAVGAPRARLVALLGCACVGGVVGYALARRSGLSLPEWAIVGYGVALQAASLGLDRKVGRTDVATLVGWSFPVLLAPLALFSLNAGLSAGHGGTAAAPVVQALVVAPTAWTLRLLGTPAQRIGSTLVLATPRGPLALGVGLVCAGLYPAVLFGGLVGFQAWSSKMPLRRAAPLLASGLAGLWALNVVRVVVLARVGIAWGMAALQAAHANLGWISFAGFMALFWWLALRRTTDPPGTPGNPGAE